MKKKLPSSFNLNIVLAKLSERLRLEGAFPKGELLKVGKPLLLFVLLVGVSLFFLRGTLMRPVEPETQPPPPPPQQAFVEPPKIAVPPPPPNQSPFPVNPPQEVSPLRPPVPQSQAPGFSQREGPEPTSTRKKERPEAPKVPRDPFLYPQVADERPPRASSSPLGSLSPSNLPPPPLPSPPSLEKVPPPPPSLPPLPPTPGQSASPRVQRASLPPQPKVVGVAFGEKTLAVLSFPGEGEVPLFVGEVYKGWRVIKVERKPNVVLVRVKAPDGKEVLLKHY